MSSTVVTARIEPDILAGLDEIASRQERSRAWLVAKVIRDFVAEETALQAFVQEGIDAADRGEMISQDDMEAWFAARRHRIAAE